MQLQEVCFAATLLWLLALLSKVKASATTKIAWSGDGHATITDQLSNSRGNLRGTDSGACLYDHMHEEKAGVHGVANVFQGRCSPTVYQD
jgi:hypothetical protein